MRVARQGLPPGVQHGQKADLRTQMLGVGDGGAQRLRHRPEQDVVNQGLVLKRDDRNLARNPEHDMVVGHVEQFRLTVLKPLGACEALALWTIAVPARVVSDTLMTAIAATLDVTAKRGGAAILDRDHGTPPRGRQQRAMLVTKSRAEMAEHTRHFQTCAGQGRAVRRARGPKRSVSSHATRPADWR